MFCQLLDHGGGGGTIDPPVTETSSTPIVQYPLRPSVASYYMYADVLNFHMTATGAHHQVSLQAAREAIVLLANGAGTLPLPTGKPQKIAVIGPTAAAVQNL